MKKIKLFMLVIVSIASITFTNAQWTRNAGAPTPTVFPSILPPNQSNDYVCIPGNVAGCRLDLSNNNTAGNYDISIGDYVRVGAVLQGPAGYRIRLRTVIHNTIGTNNFCMGDSAGYNITGASVGNTLGGYGSGLSLTSGVNNSCYGIYSGRGLTSGVENSFFGKYAGYSNTTGVSNCFMGSETGLNTSTGGDNVFIGSQAGYTNSTGADNVFSGFRTGYSNTADYNVFTGSQAGYTNSSGGQNSFYGYKSGYTNATGTDDAFYGYKSGFNNTASYNVFAGSESGFTNTSGAQNSFYGHRAGYTNSTGADNVFFGFKSGYNNTASYNVFTGSESGYTNSSGSRNSYYGYRAGYTNSTEDDNSFFGYRAGYNNAAERNTFMGAAAGFDNTSGDNNAFFGYNAGTVNAAGQNNSFFGSTAGSANIDGEQNTYIGYSAGFSNNQSGTVGNTYVGYNSGLHGASGKHNVYLGNTAGGGGGTTSNPTGDDNVAVGYFAGRYIEAGTQNTYLGSRAGEWLSASMGANTPNGSTSNSTAIGYMATFDSSNRMAFGNENVQGWYFGRGEFDYSAVTRLPALQVGKTSTNGNGAALSRGGVWENASDVNLKTDIQDLDGAIILNKINNIKITRWMYKGTDNEYHIGPMAQDFYNTFNVGTTDKRIGTVDPAGVALAGIQQLSKQNDELKTQVEQQNRDIENLKNELVLMKSSKISKVGNVQLMQNNPNPFSVSTTINYIVPEGIGQAQLNIYSMNGALVKTYNVATRGMGSVIINGGELKAGSYVYSLVTDGMSSENHIMILIAN